MLLFSVFISCSAHSLPPLFPAYLCFSPLHSPLSVFFSSVFPPRVLLLLLLSHFFFFSGCCPSSSRLPLLLFSLFSLFSSLFLLSLSPHCHLSSLLSPFVLFFPSVVFPPFLLGPSSAFYSQRMHALWQAYGNGWRALWW